MQLNERESVRMRSSEFRLQAAPPEYLDQTGASEAERVWREYALHDYGKNWDDPEM
jgi:hypothetical protein